MAQPKTTKVEEAEGRRADFLVYYRRGGRPYFDAIWGETPEQAEETFRFAAADLGWRIEEGSVRVERRDPC